METPPPKEPTHLTETSDQFARVFERITSLLAPITTIAALLYYFGWTRTNAICSYFGIDPAILQRPVDDYLIRATGPAFVLFAAGLTTAAVLLILARLGLALEQAIERRPTVLPSGRLVVWRPVTTVSLYLGALGAWCGLRIALGFADVGGVAESVGLTQPLRAAASLAIGVPVLLFGIRLLTHEQHLQSSRRVRTLSPAMRGSALALTVFATFWVTAIVSEQSGQNVALAVNEDPTVEPEVTLYSDQDLDLPDREQAAQVSAGPYHFIYSNLRLFAYSGERWILFTGDRSSSGRLVAVIVRDDEHVRVHLSR